MSWFTDLYRSAVGKKAVMAVSGILLFGFVLAHGGATWSFLRAGDVLPVPGRHRHLRG